VGFAAKAAGLSAPAEYVALKRWYEVISNRPAQRRSRGIAVPVHHAIKGLYVNPHRSTLTRSLSYGSQGRAVSGSDRTMCVWSVESNTARAQILVASCAGDRVIGAPSTGR